MFLFSNRPWLKPDLCMHSADWLRLLLLILERAIQKYFWVQMWRPALVLSISLVEKERVFNIIYPPLPMDRTPTSKKAPEMWNGQIWIETGNQPVDPAGQSLHELFWFIHSFPDENIERFSFWTMINHGVGQLCNITRNIWLSIIIYAQDFHLLPLSIIMVTKSKPPLNEWQKMVRQSRQHWWRNSSLPTWAHSCFVIVRIIICVIILIILICANFLQTTNKKYWLWLDFAPI